MKDYKNLHYIVLVSQIGISMALPIVGGIYVGAHLDKKLSTSSAFLIIGALLGIFTGAYGVYKLVSYDLKRNKNKQ